MRRINEFPPQNDVLPEFENNGVLILPDYKSLKYTNPEGIFGGVASYPPIAALNSTDASGIPTGVFGKGKKSHGPLCRKSEVTAICRA
jgi:hypothetical protein